MPIRLAMAVMIAAFAQQGSRSIASQLVAEVI
jgi:hypothetical protein